MKAAFALLLLLLPCSAAASPFYGRHTVLAYGKVGGIVPLSNLDVTVSVRLGVGYIPPVLGRRFALVADLGYFQSDDDGTGFDKRLFSGRGAEFRYAFTLRALSVFLGPQVFLRSPDADWIPFVAAGADVQFVNALINGQIIGSENNPAYDFGENSESTVHVGVAGRVGLAYRLGPEMLLSVEVAGGYTPVDSIVLGRSHLSRLSLLLGFTGLFMR